MLLLLAAAAESGEEVATGGNPILPDSSEMFYGVISFALLYLLIDRVLLPPLMRARSDRAATIRADRDAAEAARAQAASASSEVDDQLAGVRAEATELIEEARAEAEAERQRLVARAEREVNAMQEIADQEIEAERTEALASLRPQVADLAIDAAGRVIGQPVDVATARPVVERVLNS